MPLYFQGQNYLLMNFILSIPYAHKLFRSVCIALLILLSGCSVKFIYNQLDWVIPWYLDDYVSFNSAQELLLDQHLEYLLSWHRKQKLPEYANFLEQLAADSRDGLDGDEIDQAHDRVQLFANQLIQATAPALSDLLKRLSDKQLNDLFDNFENLNREFQQKYIDVTEQKQRFRRAKEMRKWIQRWTGLLDDTQVELIHQWSTEYHLMGREFLHSRQQWQRQLKKLLQQPQKNSSWQLEIENLLSNNRARHAATFEQKVTSNHRLIKQLLLDLDQSLSDKQRLKLNQQLESYAQDFRQLSIQ